MQRTMAEQALEAATICKRTAARYTLPQLRCLAMAIVMNSTDWPKWFELDGSIKAQNLRYVLSTLIDVTLYTDDELDTAIAAVADFFR